MSSDSSTTVDGDAPLTLLSTHILPPPLALAQERVAKFLKEKESGSLSFLKTQSAISAATAPVDLLSMTPGTLCIGDRIQLRHDGE